MASVASRLCARLATGVNVPCRPFAGNRPLAAGGRLVYVYRILFEKPVSARYVRMTCACRTDCGILLAEIRIVENAAAAGYSMNDAPTTAAGVAAVEEIRERFPALARRHNGAPVAYFDGPGGTQVPREVADA